MMGNGYASLAFRVVEHVVTPGCMIEYESVLLEYGSELSRSELGEFRHTLSRDERGSVSKIRR